MSFSIGNEHIKNQLVSNQFGNAMDITSFLTDGIVFSLGYDLPNTQWKLQWMKYCDMIMPQSGFRIEYEHPYNSRKLKDITEYEIYKEDKFIEAGTSHCYESAKAQAYIKISQLSTFSKVTKEGLPKVKWITDKIDDYYFRVNPNDRNYRLKHDLKRVVDNKALLREWKLSIIDI